jgi:hypothetical protein
MTRLIETMKGVEEWRATYLFASQVLGLRESRDCQHAAIRMEYVAHLPPSSLSLRAEMNMIRHFFPKCQ